MLLGKAPKTQFLPLNRGKGRPQNSSSILNAAREFENFVPTFLANKNIVFKRLLTYQGTLTGLDVIRIVLL